MIAAIAVNIRTKYAPRMFGFSAEHLIVLAIVLLIFGPRKLPELGQTLGRAMRNFKDGLAGVENAAFQKVEDKITAAVAVDSTRPTESTAQPIHAAPPSSESSQKSEAQT